jgi:mannose-6-phosphate isomerase class I
VIEWSAMPTVPPPYEPNPHYPTVGGSVTTGWDMPIAELSSMVGNGPTTLAIDGPAAVDWEHLVEEIGRATLGLAVTWFDVRRCLVPWPELVRRTASVALADDPDFDHLATADLAQLFDQLPAPPPADAGLTIAFGPGAALAPYDVLWYVDLPKRFAEAAISAGGGVNLGRSAADGPATTKRLFYIDWPLLDRHRDEIWPRVDRWFDLQQRSMPASIDGSTLQQTVKALARRPFRTRPTFNTTPWGGHWGQRQLDMNTDAPNTALGYELIAPESGVLCGDAAGTVELPFQAIVARHPADILGAAVHDMFGTSFPIRFDYLDTVDGGNLSVHCHPREEYMREVFGWPYTQHETYYVMVGGESGRVFLGLRGDLDVEAFHRDAKEAHLLGEPFDIEQHVQVFPATQHQLFCVPAGTPHGSGVGNVILEVSATPYLYSLRFYDWLRRDTQGKQRPVHVDHAFTNLDLSRAGAAVPHTLVQQPRMVREGDGWHEEMLGTLPEMFFEVRRIVLDADVEAPDDSTDGFHVLNVVEGDGVSIEAADGTSMTLAYAETLVVPAAVGPYRLRRLGDNRVRLVKALVQ